MKKILPILALLVAGAAQAADYQEVVTFKGTAQNIINNANKAFGVVTTKSVLGDTLTVATKIDCDKGWLGKITMYGDIIIEAKQDRFRITFDDMKADTGYSLKELPQNKEACEASFKKVTQTVTSKMSSFGNNNW
jgi:hypothetical protein